MNTNIHATLTFSSISVVFEVRGYNQSFRWWCELSRDAALSLSRLPARRPEKDFCFLSPIVPRNKALNTSISQY
jgi:hypothetical protein